MTAKARFFTRAVCLFLAVFAACSLLTACNDFPDEEEPKEAKTYELGELAFIPASAFDSDKSVSDWLKNCRENNVESIKIYSLLSYDEATMTSVYLFYLPHVNKNVSINAKIITYDYKQYDAFIDFQSGDEVREEDVVYYLKTELIRPSLLQKNVSYNGKSGVMMSTSAQQTIDLSGILSDSE